MTPRSNLREKRLPITVMKFEIFDLQISQLVCDFLEKWAELMRSHGHTHTHQDHYSKQGLHSAPTHEKKNGKRTTVGSQDLPDFVFLAKR